MFKKRNIALSVLTLLVSSMLFADTDRVHVFNTNVLNWQDSKEMPGAKIVVLVGDPTKKEYFVSRIQYPANYVVPPHSHPIDEYDTVISGDYHLGVGRQVNQKNSISLKQGAFVIIPAGTIHYGWTNQETVLQTSGMGPWGVTKFHSK